MPKKQSVEEEIIKARISARANITVAVITGSVTLLVALISVIWGPMLLKTMNKEPSPTIEPTSATRDWYVIFELKFPAYYWTEGPHSYLFDANCPFGINSTGAEEPTYMFTVDKVAQIQKSTVFIRRRGLYLTEIEGDAFGHFIHPSQETAAIYSPFALSFEDAKRLRDECKVLITIDDKASMDLSPIKIDKIH